MKKRGPTIPIVVEGETWEVPFGFAHDYQQAVALERTKPGWGLAELLLLIGYAATTEQIGRWSLHRRVEVSVYAANVHLRASDNPMPIHPRPSWLPEPWCGPEGKHPLDGAGPTPIADEVRRA